MSKKGLSDKATNGRTSPRNYVEHLFFVLFMRIYDMKTIIIKYNQIDIYSLYKQAKLRIFHNMQDFQNLVNVRLRAKVKLYM